MYIQHQVLRQLGTKPGPDNVNNNGYNTADADALA
jgi:hypothetical protein